MDIEPKKIACGAPLEIEFQFNSDIQVNNFKAAFLKLCDTNGRPIGKMITCEENFKVTFVGSLNNLCSIWYVFGALAEREAVKVNMFQAN